MFHHKKSRIEAHIAICYISLAIVRTIELQLKKQGIKISFMKLKEELSKVGYCVVSDAESGSNYKLPLKITPETRNILACLNVTYGTGAVKIIN